MSLLAAAGSILGGLLGRSKPKVISAGDNFYSHISGVMNAAKDFGFNPFTLLQNGQAIGPTVTQSDNSAFGAGVANAFALAGDALLSKRATSAKLNQYQQQNQRLQSKVNAITLRAPVPGVYGRARHPSDPEVYGAGEAARGAGEGIPPVGIPVPDPYLDVGSGSYVGGVYLKPTPGWSPGNVYENEYGEVGGAMLGLAKFGRDMAYNAKLALDPYAPTVSSALKGGVDRLKAASAYNRSMTFGTPLAEPEYPPIRYKLYGLPRDTSQRFRPMPKRERAKKLHDLHALGF